MVNNGSGETLYKWLTIFYTSIKSPLCLLQNKESKSRCCSLVSYGSCANSGTNLVALCCIRSSLSMFFTKNGFQIETQYSRCGRTYVLYSIKNDSLVRWVNVLFINPRDCITLADAGMTYLARKIQTFNIQYYRTV